MELIWSREELESLLDHPSRNVQRWAIERALDLYPDLSDRVIALLPSASGNTASFILDSLCDHHVFITEPGPLLEAIETFEREDIEAASTALLLRSGHTPPGYDPGTVELGRSASILADTGPGFNHLLQLYHRCEEDNSSVLYALSQACSFDEVFDELACAEDGENVTESLEHWGYVWGCDLSDLDGALGDGAVPDILDSALTRTVASEDEPWKRGILAELDEDRTHIESIRDVARLRTSLSEEEETFLLACVLCLRRNEACQNRLLDAGNACHLWAALVIKAWRGTPGQALQEFLLREQPEELLSSLDDALSRADFHGAYPFQLLNSIEAPGRFEFFKEALDGKYDDVISDEAEIALKEAGFPAVRYIMQHHHELSPGTRLSVLRVLDSLPTREVVDFYISHFEEYMHERGSTVFVESLRKIASSRFLPPLLEEWREGEIRVGGVIRLISEIHGIWDERIDTVIKDVERITPRPESLSPEDENPLLEYIKKGTIEVFPLRCTQCGHTYHYKLKNIFVDENRRFTIADIVECKRCGALQAYELTSDTHLSINAEITRQLMLLDQGEPPESIDGSVKPSKHLKIRAGGQEFESVVEAYHFLRAQIEKHPQDSVLQQRMGNILRNGGRSDLALPYYLEAINLNPGDAESCYCISDILIGQGRYEEAIPYVEQLVPLCREGKMDDNLRRDMFRALLEQAYIIEEKTGHKVEVFQYSELNQRANGLANALLSIGVDRGDRVAILSHNCSQYVETYFATAKGGVPIVPLNTNLDADGTAYIINDSGANTLIFADKYLDMVNELRPRLETVKHYIAIGNAEGAEPYEELVANHPKDEPEVSVDEDDIAWMLYTSGTTGRPKGVMLSHKSQIADSANTILTCYPISRNDVHLSLLPMFHIGCMWHMRCHFYMGSTNVIMDTLDPKTVLETIQRERVSTTCIVPPMVVPVINYPDVDKYDVSSMRIIIYSGAPMSEAMMARMNEIFGDIVIQVYALTEGGPAIIMPPLMEGPWKQVKRKASCGKAVLNVEVKLVNEEGGGCGVGEVGEIVARGDNIMSGYWNIPEDTAKALKDRFLHTGDLASKDEEGYFYFTGRRKDTIASGDRVVYSPEVEDVISMRPTVLEVAVIGVPDEELGEVVKAVVVVRGSKEITKEEIADWCKGKIEDYKMPKLFDFVDSLPKNPGGKVLKTVLRERYSK